MIYHVLAPGFGEEEQVLHFRQARISNIFLSVHISVLFRTAKSIRYVSYYFLLEHFEGI